MGSVLHEKYLREWNIRHQMARKIDEMSFDEVLDFLGEGYGLGNLCDLSDDHDLNRKYKIRVEAIEQVKKRDVEELVKYL